MAPVEAPERARLREHFESDPADSSRWDKLWTQSFTPWDRGLPSPALVDLLASKPASLPFLAQKGVGGKRLKALVPGCGKGYDVFLLASWGFDAFGLEISGTAADAARVEGQRVDVAVAKGEVEAYATKDEGVGRGTWEVIVGDFYSDSWSAVGGYDVIYDYTFFCAMPPQLRPKWAARMARLLAPGGRLICLEFPTYKEPSTGGPPWAVRPNEYVAYLSKPGETIQYGEDGLVKDIDEDSPDRSGDGLVRIAHFQPERTHEIGKGTDWISVWKHQ